EGQVIIQVGAAAHPHSYQRGDFSWKVVDGDSKVPGKPKNGKPGRAPCEKEGYPGHWVFNFRTTIPIKFVNADGSAYLLDKDAVRPGDYVQIFGSCAGNTGATPGVYLNPQFISLQWKGEPIMSGPDPKSLGFGGQAKPAGFKAPTGVPGAGPVLPGLPQQAGQPALAAGIPGVPAAPGVGAPAMPGVGTVAAPNFAGAPAAPMGQPGLPQMPGSALPAMISPSNGVPGSFPATPTAVQPHAGFLAPPVAPAAPVAPAQPVLNPALAAAGHTWASLQ